MVNEESSLSNWAGPYVTEMLGRGQALGSQPYTPYQGPLTAGQSGLQDQAFSGLAGLSTPTNMGAYTPQSFTGAAPQQGGGSAVAKPISNPAQFPPLEAGHVFLPTPQPSGPMEGWTTWTPEQKQMREIALKNLNRPSPPKRNGITELRMLDQQSHLDGYWGEEGNPNAIENRRTYDPNNRRTPEDIMADIDASSQRRIAAQDRFDVANPNYEYPEGAGPVSTPTNRAAEQARKQDERERLDAMFPPISLYPLRNSSPAAAQSPIQQYMSPYLEGALQPQYDAANRQAQVQRQAMQSRYGKAGAYGGSRQAVAGAELDRGLLDRMSGITGTGYQNAFEQAQKQFNAEQDREMAAQQNTNSYGLDVLRAQQDAGALQRGIEQEGIAADRAQFREERDYDKNNTLFMQSLLQGLPLETQRYSYSEPSGLQNIAGGVSDVTNILDEISSIGGENPANNPAFQGQYDYYIAMGETPAQATARAKADLGIG